MSWVDAHDRLERHMTALKLLITLAQAETEAQALHDSPTSEDPEFASSIGLDVPGTTAAV